MTIDQTYAETPAEADFGHLAQGTSITVDELRLHLSAIDLRLRQLARAAETPATPVELEHVISTLRSTAQSVQRAADEMQELRQIIEGEKPLARTLPSGDGWGSAAVGTDREDFGGPAIIPTQRQLQRLASDAGRAGEAGTVTYAEMMAAVPRSILLSWESKFAAGRRAEERNAAVQEEVLLIGCERCEAGEGIRCKTSSGWETEQPHTKRLREAEARVDTRLGYVGPNPVDVPDA